MNAPVRDCYFTSPTMVIMPFINGTPANEQNETELPRNAQGTALQLFDYLVANADRRPKNWIITSDNRIVGIDHALCNFRPRHPKAEFVAEMWNNGLTLEGLERLRPHLAALVLDFTSLGMVDKHDNLMANFDRLLSAFQTLNQVAVVVKDALTPPKGVQEAAQRALGWLKDGKAGKGFTPVGRKRASDLANAHPVSLDTLKRMKAYFDRHQVDQKAEGFHQDEDGYPSPGRVAWDAWGGDAGWSWAKSVVESSEVKKEEAGHEFRGNQHTGGIPGAGGSKDEGGGKSEGGSKGGSEAPRQSDPGRNAVSADRYQVSSESNSTSTEKPKDEAAKPDEAANTDTKDAPKGDEAKKVWAQDHAQQILDGEMPTIAPDSLLAYFQQVANLPPEFQVADATEINTETEGPSGLPLLGDEGYGGNVPRDDMPQINGDEQKREFIAELEKMGVTTTEERVDPNTLIPFQKEMLSGKIGTLVLKNPTGIPDSQRIIVSDDGKGKLIIIDGHHNFAAGVALYNGLASKPLLPIFRVKMDVDKLRPLAYAFGEKKGNAPATMNVKTEASRLVKKAHGKSAEAATKTILEMIAIPARRAHARNKVKKGATGAVPRYEGETYDTAQPQPEMQSWANLGEGQKVPQSHAEKGDALASKALELWRDQRYESAGYAHEDAASAYRREAKITTDPHERASLEGKAKDQDNEAKAAHFTDQMGEAHSPTEIYKGDVVGHDFHGNQHTGGIDGGGSDSNSGGEARQSDPSRNQVSPDRYRTAADYLQSLRDKVSDGSSETSNTTSKFIGESAADFTNAGGKTYEVKTNMGFHDSEAIYKLGLEVDEEAKRQGFKSLERYDAPDKKTEPEKYQKWAGLYMMSAALTNSVIRDNEDAYQGAVRIFIARDAEGRIAGAAQVQNNSYIHYIGSNNEVDGAGTALISNIIRNSAENDVGVAFEPLPSAIPFWEKAGFKPKYEGSKTYVLRSADAKQVAEQLKAMKVTKGDVEGHPFHGNQYTAAEHVALAEKASQEALKHEQKAADLEERGKNTRAITHALQGVQARMREKQHRDAAEAVVEKAKPKWLTLLDEETKAHKDGDEDKANQIHYDVISALYDEQEVKKGDNVGHPFRGNQFTSGQGEVAPETQEHIEGLTENLRQVGDEQEQGNRLRADRHKIAAAWHFLRLMSDKDEVKKGEAEGHPFRGNQHTQGQGGAEMPANVGAFARNLKEFYGAGGKVERIDSENKMLNVYHQALALQETPEYKSMDDRHQQGIRFLAEAALHASVAQRQEANGQYQITGSYLFVARDPEGTMVSAVNVTTRSGGVRLGDLSDPELPHASIGYLGSTGTMPGAATALMEQALQLAADKGLTVTYETTEDSQPYHDKLGVQMLNYRGLRGFSPESAAEVAALPNPDPTIIKSEIIKGDLPGHVFHGNQHVEVAGEGRTTSPRKPATKKPSIAGLPKGWKMQSKDGSRVVLTSKNGNTAIFATKARGWKPSEKYSRLVLEAAERLTSGKTINFVAEADTGRNSLAYVNRYNPDVIGMGRYSTVKGTIDHQMEQFEKQVANTALSSPEMSQALAQMEKGSPEREALITKMAEMYDQQPRTEAEVKGISHSYAAFATPEKVIETMMNHELGHSDFFAEGHKISEIYPALAEAAKAAYDASFQSGGSRVISLPSFTAPEIWAQTQENAARDIVSKTSSRYSGFDFGNGVIVPRADYVDYSVKEGAGSNNLRETPQSILRFLGVTQYGSTKLQETVAEARAFYSTPGLPKSALTNRLGEILGWDKTQKSATLSFVKAEDDSVPPASANVYQDKDGNLIARVFDTVDTSGNGAITIVGEEVILSDGSVMSLDDYNASITTP